MRRTPIPTLEEIPATPDDYSRELEDFLPLSLIPADDASLRSLAIKMFNLSEDDCNGETTHKSDKSFHGAYKQMLLRPKDLPDIAAVRYWEKFEAGPSECRPPGRL